MAENFRIAIKKQLCEVTFEHIDLMEIYKDIMDGDSLITSFLIEVSCLKFRQCDRNCLYKKDILTVKKVASNVKQKTVVQD